jgi:hypothetical protein
MRKEKRKIGFDEEGMKLPEEVRNALEIAIRNAVQNFFKQKERQERSEGDK